MKIKSKEGEWNLDAAQTQSAPVIDPGIGEDRVIRQFLVKSPPDRHFTAEEVLHGLTPLLKKNVIKDGWTFEREPEIQALKDGFNIICILRPAIKNMTVVGATNATPRNASDLLKEGNLQRAKKRV